MAHSSECRDQCAQKYLTRPHARWFEGLMSNLGFELWIGDAAEIRSKRVRKQKTDRQDAQLLLQLLLENRFPQIWIASGENRDLRQLLRRRMVQARTRIMNQLQAVALNEGLRCKKRLWRNAFVAIAKREHERIATSPDRKFIRRGSRLLSGTTKRKRRIKSGGWIRIFGVRSRHARLGILTSRPRGHRFGLFRDVQTWHEPSCKAHEGTSRKTL